MSKAIQNKLLNWIRKVRYKNTASAETSETHPLYADVVQEVLNFLNLKELHNVAHLCKQWLRVLRSIKPIGISVNSVPFAAYVQDKKRGVVRDCPSTLGRHLDQIHHQETGTRHHRFSDEYRHALEKLQPLRLALGKCFPNLTSLPRCRTLYPFCLDPVFSTALQKNQPIVLPGALTSFNATISQEFCATLFPTLAQASSLTSLELHFGVLENDCAVCNIDFSPLHALHNLEDVCYNVMDTTWHRRNSNAMPAEDLSQLIPPSFITFVRKLPQLRTLAIGGESKTMQPFMPEFVRLIGEKPHELKLTYLNFFKRMTLDAPLLRAMTLIPSLTEFHHYSFHVCEPSLYLLSSFPNLKALRLYGEQVPKPLPNVCFAAKSCTHVQEVSLNKCALTSEDLDAAFAFLPQMTSLNLLHMDLLTSLAFLAHNDLPLRLKTLRIEVAALTIMEFDYLFRLEQLTQLQLVRPFGEYRLSEEEQKRLPFGFPIRLPGLVTPDQFTLYI